MHTIFSTSQLSILFITYVQFPILLLKPFVQFWKHVFSTLRYNVLVEKVELTVIPKTIAELPGNAKYN